MSLLVFTDCFLSIGGTDYSANVQSVTLNYSAEMLDDTAMGDTARSNAGGMKVWNMDVTFHNDYTDNGIDEILFGLVGVTAALILRPVKSTVVGAGNPNFTGTGILEGLPQGGGVGALDTKSVSFKSAGTLTRAVA